MRARLDALGPNGAYRSQKRQSIADVTGTAVGDMSLVSRLFVTRTLSALRAASPLREDDRYAAIAEAGKAFAQGTVGGLSAEEYQRAVSRVSGLPYSITNSAMEATAITTARLRELAHQARPRGAATDWRKPGTVGGQAVWTRRGNVFAVHAPGNTPAVHNLWLSALALGYRVAVRPSVREPFGPHRMISALRDAGFGPEHVVFMPTGHEVADAVLAGADLALAYGSDEVIAKYSRVTTLLPQGPGRSKILIAGDWRPHLDTVVDAVTGHGGTACVNTTAVFVDGDPAPLAEALAERLSRLPGRAPEHPEAVLPVQRVDTARALEKHLLTRAEGTRSWLGAEGIVEELGDGSAALHPAVHQTDRADAPQLEVELPFPCVWLAPWSSADGLEPFRDTLVLTAITEDEALIDALLEEPSIANLYIGSHPTHWMSPGLPHDDYLESFLMRTKTVLR